MKNIKIFVYLIFIVIFTSFVSSTILLDSTEILNELKNLINESENLIKPYYVSNVPELNNYWSEFYSIQNESKIKYNIFKDNETLELDEIIDLDFTKEELEKSITLIKSLNDLEKAFTDRPASINSNKGFEITINEQSLTENGRNRLRVEYDRKSSTVYLLMSNELQGQTLADGTSGLGLGAAMMNVMSSDYCEKVKSGDQIINLYYLNRTKKSNNVIKGEAEDLALDWAGVTSFWDLLKNYNTFSGKSEVFTILGNTTNIENVTYGVEFERNFYFNFIDAGVQNFESEYSYCYINSKTVKCNKVEYYDLNNNLINLEKVEYGKSAESFFPEDLEGYTFKGWNSSLNKITSDLKVSPIYERTEYKVIFKDYNGTILNQQDVFYGEDAIPPKSPIREGYNFLKWDINYTNVKTNLTILAVYEEIKYVYEINNTNNNISISIDKNISSYQINLSELINSTGQGSIPRITINASNANNISVNIPATNITSSNISWNGIIEAPKKIDVIIPTIEGKSRTQSIAIKIGFNDGKLIFSNAVRLLFPNETGKKIAYFSEGNFNEIKNICGEDNQTWVDLNLNGGIEECYINNGSDLVVWTKHFTEFVTYTESDLPKTGGGSSGSSSSSSSSSSKGFGSSSLNCNSLWVCSDWSNCTNNLQKRICQDSNNCLIPDIKKPIEMRDCNSSSKKIISLNNPIKTGIGLGAIIGLNKETYGILFLGLFLLLSFSIILFFKKSKTFK